MLPYSNGNEWPICEVEGCEEEVDPRRVKLVGAVRCLNHGEARREFTVAPAYNKGGYQLVTQANVRDIGKA